MSGAVELHDGLASRSGERCETGFAPGEFQNVSERHAHRIHSDIRMLDCRRAAFISREKCDLLVPEEMKKKCSSSVANYDDLAQLLSSFQYHLASRTEVINLVFRSS
jgi:hypothetical protein